MTSGTRPGLPWCSLAAIGATRPPEGRSNQLELRRLEASSTEKRVHPETHAFQAREVVTPVFTQNQPGCSRR
jgi:hypothetical protein